MRTSIICLTTVTYVLSFGLISELKTSLHRFFWELLIQNISAHNPSIFCSIFTLNLSTWILMLLLIHCQHRWMIDRSVSCSESVINRCVVPMTISSCQYKKSKMLCLHTILIYHSSRIGSISVYYSFLSLRYASLGGGSGHYTLFTIIAQKQENLNALEVIFQCLSWDLRSQTALHRYWPVRRFAFLLCNRNCRTDIWY